LLKLSAVVKLVLVEVLLENISDSFNTLSHRVQEIAQFKEKYFQYILVAKLVKFATYHHTQVAAAVVDVITDWYNQYEGDEV